MSTQDNKDRKFKTPVSWLMGRELLAGLKWIASYTLMGDKQDHRNWMLTETIQPPRQNNGEHEPYWFDYIADTGDGMSAAYNIAYLCMSELWLESKPQTGAEAVALTADSQFNHHLPRGEFLFIGGDTAYHIADTASLKERFQTPFNWAAADIASKTGKAVERRPLYGIPANHDYYDSLDGFNRQFCLPIDGDKTIATDGPNAVVENPKFPQLRLAGFERKQTASYVALQLPFEWQLWGLDAQEGKMDKRQRAFFVSTFAKAHIDSVDLFDKSKQTDVLKLLQSHCPKKLIVATPEPSTVFGKWATEKDVNSVLNDGPDNPKEQMVATFAELGLDPSFISTKHGMLESGKCRLDISGDIHHYERYWGSTPEDSHPNNYASIVAGGGAFLHPSQTDIKEVNRQNVYPSAKDSHRLMTQKLLNPFTIFLGGYIWLTGGIIAFMSYFALTIPQSTWSLFKVIPDSLRLDKAETGLLAQIRVALDTTNYKPCCESSFYYDLAYIILFIGLLAYWLYQTPKHFDAISQAQSQAQKADEHTKRRIWQRGLLLFIAPVIVGFAPFLIFMNWNRDQLPHAFLSGLLIDLFFIAAALLFGLSRRYSDILIKRAKITRETLTDLVPLWVLNISALIYAIFGIFRYGAYSTSIMTFNLLIVIVWLLTVIGLPVLAYYVGGYLLKIRGKLFFATIGVWHAFIQISLPVALTLYADSNLIVIISASAIALTLLAGRVFSHDFWVKDLSPQNQKKLGGLLIVTWIALGLGVLFPVADNMPLAVNGWRLLTAFLLGLVFSCTWFGWYLTVSLAFHGHNNEAGGGARSERYRHMIRFKLEENQLTGYVIGIDQPVTDFTVTSTPKFRLVDVFTIRL